MIVTDGQYAFQSFGRTRNNLRYLGRLECCLRALVYQRFDEILIAVPAELQTINDYPFVELVRNLEANYVGLPITLAGGTTEQLNTFILERQCVERLAVNSLIFQSDALQRLRSIQESYGEQFIIANIPVLFSNDTWCAVDQSSGKLISLAQLDYDLLNCFDEVMFHFIDNQGFFVDTDSLDILGDRIAMEKIILAGGMNSIEILKKAKWMNVASILADNYALYSEHIYAL